MDVISSVLNIPLSIPKSLNTNEVKLYQSLRNQNVSAAKAAELCKKTFIELQEMGYFGGIGSKKPKRAKQTDGVNAPKKQALRALGVKRADIVRMSPSSLKELERMGYKFTPLQLNLVKDDLGLLPESQGLMTNVSEVPTPSLETNNDDTLKTLGIPSANAVRLSEESFSGLKKMGFKFTPLKPKNKPAKKKLIKAKGNPETPKVLPAPPLSQNCNDQQQIRVCIKNISAMSDSQLDVLSKTILGKIATMPPGEGPKFKGCNRESGLMRIICADERSKHWLEELVPSLKPWPEASFRVTPDETPKPIVALLFIPDKYATDIEQTLSLLRVQNNGLHTELWKVLKQKAVKGGVILCLSLDKESVENLEKTKRRANLGFSQVKFKIKDSKKSKNYFLQYVSNTVSLEHNQPGTSKSDSNQSHAANSHATPIPANFSSTNALGTSQACSSEKSSTCLEVPPYKQGTEDTQSQQYTGNQSTQSSKDVRDDNDGISYNSEEDLFEGAENSNSEDDNIDTSYRDRDINQDFYSRRGDLGGNIGGGSSYNKDIREYINEGTSYSYRDSGGIPVGTSYCGELDFRSDMQGSNSYRCTEDIERNVNKDAGYSSKEDLRRETEEDSYREDFGGAMHESAWYKDREEMKDQGVVDNDRVFLDKDKVTARGNINGGPNQTRDRAGNQGQPFPYSMVMNFRDGSYSNTKSPSNSNYRDFTGNTGETSVYTSGFGVRGCRQRDQHFTSTVYTDRDNGEDIRVKVLSGFGVRSNITSTGSYRDWGIRNCSNNDVRRVFERRRENQISEMASGRVTGVFGDSGINSMNARHTERSQGYETRITKDQNQSIKRQRFFRRE